MLFDDNMPSAIPADDGSAVEEKKDGEIAAPEATPEAPAADEAPIA